VPHPAPVRDRAGTGTGTRTGTCCLQDMSGSAGSSGASAMRQLPCGNRMNAEGTTQESLVTAARARPDPNRAPATGTTLLHSGPNSGHERPERQAGPRSSGPRRHHRLPGHVPSHGWAPGSGWAANRRPKDRHDRCRSVTDHARTRALHLPSPAAFSPSLTICGPADIQAGNRSLDLPRKGPEVQLLPRPPHPL
jgi:hypothetical protein